MSIKNKLIVALDVDTLIKAKYFINALYPQVTIFKIGSQLFTAEGPRAVSLVRRKGAEVFLDLKYFDIPNTVAQAVRQAVRLGVKMLTLHITGGEEMIRAAVSAARDEAQKQKVKKTLLIGVTVLTSQKTSKDGVLSLARKGISWGLDGVVCSAQEVSLLRRKIKSPYIIITPGIRPQNAETGDQKRVATAEEAVKAGSDYLVVGRPVLEARDPRKAVEQLG